MNTLIIITMLVVLTMSISHLVWTLNRPRYPYESAQRKMDRAKQLAGMLTNTLPNPYRLPSMNEFMALQSRVSKLEKVANGNSNS